MREVIFDLGTGFILSVLSKLEATKRCNTERKIDTIQMIEGLMVQTKSGYTREFRN